MAGDHDRPILDSGIADATASTDILKNPVQK
jgi:hypothetical protein